MPLNPESTNKMTCSVCGWSRIVDPLREYRSGHTLPGTEGPGEIDCHEMLTYTELDPRAPDPAWFELDDLDDFTPTWGE